MILSILIPSIPERSQQLDELLNELYRQKRKSKYVNHLQIVPLITPKMFSGGKHIGEKRQELIEFVNSEYVVFIDDDDMVEPSYIEDITKALESKPDSVTFCGWMTTDGHNLHTWEIRDGNNYCQIGNSYLRPPNHLTVIKREIALKIGYNTTLSTGEDYDYCMRLAISKLIKNEVHIPKQLYHYKYSHHNKIHP